MSLHCVMFHWFSFSLFTVIGHTMKCFYPHIWCGLAFYWSKILYANKTQRAYFHFLGLICHVDCKTNYSWVMLLLCCSLVDVSLQGRMWFDMMMHRRVDKHLDAMQTTSWGGLSNHISPSEHHKCAYIWIHTPLSVMGQLSNHQCHIYARCKLADNHWATTLCVCVCVCVQLNCLCVHEAVMDLNVGALVCVILDSYQFESLCMTDCFVCLTTIEKGSISLLFTPSLPFLCVSLSTQFHLKRSFSSLSCLCWSQQAQYITV